MLSCYRRTTAHTQWLVVRVVAVNVSASPNHRIVELADLKVRYSAAELAREFGGSDSHNKRQLTYPMRDPCHLLCGPSTDTYTTLHRGRHTTVHPKIALKALGCSMSATLG